MAKPIIPGGRIDDGGNGLMAPWWSHLLDAKEDGKVLLHEVARDIEPFKDHLASDQVYRASVQALVSKDGGADGVKASRYAKPKIEELLEQNPLMFKFDARVLGRAHFSPGSGIRPWDADPSWYGGPSVSFKVQFTEGTAKPVTKAHYEGNKLIVTVHGESSMHTRMRSFPQDVEVRVPRPPTMGMYKLYIKNEDGRTIGRGDDFSGIPPAGVNPM